MFTDANIDAFKTKLQMLCQNLKFDIDSVNVVYQIFIDGIHACLNDFPFRIKRIKKHNASWINSDYIKLAQNRDKATRLAKKTKQQIDINNAKSLKNKCNVLARNLKQKYFSQHIADCKNNPKKGWKLINSFLTSKKGNKNCELLKIHNTLITDKGEIVKCFNEYYIDVVDAFILDSEVNPSLNPPFQNNGTSCFGFVEVENDDVEKLLSSISSSP